jgi:hypothetical protein
MVSDARRARRNGEQYVPRAETTDQSGPRFFQAADVTPDEFHRLRASFEAFAGDESGSGIAASGSVALQRLLADAEYFNCDREVSLGTEASPDTAAVAAEVLTVTVTAEAPTGIRAPSRNDNPDVG